MRTTRLSPSAAMRLIHLAGHLLDVLVGLLSRTSPFRLRLASTRGTCSQQQNSYARRECSRARRGGI